MNNKKYQASALCTKAMCYMVPKFNSDKQVDDKFWEIMRIWSTENIVFISETTAPNDFVCVWEKSTHRTAAQSDKTRYKTNNTEKYSTEKLFIHSDLLKTLQ